MKKNLIFILLLIPFSINAQLFEGGIIGGITASQIDGDGLGGYHKIGLSADVYAKLLLSENWKIVSGVGYSSKGAMSDIKYDYDVTTLNYAEIPILMEYQAFDKISFTAGLNYGYLINGYEKTSGATYNEKDLNLLKNEISTYFSANFKLSDKFTIVLAHDYSLLPVNKYDNILTKNVFIYYILYNRQLHPLWWNNSLRLSLQYKIFWTKGE